MQKTQEMQEMRVRSLGQKDPLEWEMALSFFFLAGKTHSLAKFLEPPPLLTCEKIFPVPRFEELSCLVGPNPLL